MRNLVIVVTGASSGIGAALAEALAGPLRVLVLLGRDRARLQRVADQCRTRGAECMVEAIDVLDHEGMSAFIARLSRQHPIDLLVANAGVFPGRRADETVESGEAASLALRTNLLATIDLVHMVLPGMLARRQGRILITSSLAGLFPLPDAPGYSAAKAGLASFGLALREAVASEGIEVVVACPGYVTTPMLAKHHGLHLGELSVDKAVSRILKGLDRNRPLFGFPRALFWLARISLLVPECLRRRALGLFRFHVS